MNGPASAAPCDGAVLPGVDGAVDVNGPVFVGRQQD